MPQALRTLACTLLLIASAPTSAGQGFPVATPESQGLSNEALAELAAEVRDYVERDLIVGCELLVIKNRHTVWHESFGHSDRESDSAWRNDTVCNIRSMTKPLTGAAAQILIDRGELGLDDSVAQYMSGFDTDAARAITVRQLLTHRAGLPLTILETMDDFDNLIDMGNAIGARGPEFEPDSRFWYSDAGTEALGALVETVAGTTIDQFIQAELLTPLGMTSSFYYLEDDDPRRTRIASLYAGGVEHWERFLDPEQGAFYPFAWGSQTLYSTPQDYAKFLAMWMDGGRVGDRVVLSEAAVQRTLTPVSPMTMMGSEERFPTLFQGLEVFYGQLSVLHTPLGEPAPAPATIIGHSGSDGTIAWAWPERDLMILLFTQSRGGGAVLRLEATIDRALIAPETYAGPTEAPDELLPYLGTYSADWGSHMREEFVVLYRDGELYLDVPSQMVFLLKDKDASESEDDAPRKWTFAIAPVISVWFERDEAGVVDCLRIRQGELTFEAPRQGTPHAAVVAAANKATPETVGQYLGRYLVPDSEGQAEVLIDRDYLAILNEEDQLFHLWKVPIADLWQVRENPAISVTFELEDGRVVSFTRHSQGGGSLVCPRVD